MTVRNLPGTTKRFTGLSTDVKPLSNVNIGSLFIEEDTGDVYELLGAAWTTTGAVGGVSAIQTTVVDLTAAQIATLNSVPVSMIPAQGAGTVIIYNISAFQFKAGDVAFITDSVLHLLQGNADLGQSSDIAFSGSDDLIARFDIGAATLQQSAIENEGILLSAGADPGGAGNGVGRLVVQWYLMALRT